MKIKTKSTKKKEERKIVLQNIEQPYKEYKMFTTLKHTMQFLGQHSNSTTVQPF